MPRVLLLLSNPVINIDVLNHSPRFENTIFDALALSELPDDQFENALREQLWIKMATFHPDQIILHVGRIFQKHPRAVLEVLRTCHREKPSLQIGCDRSTEFVRRYLDQETSDQQTIDPKDIISENNALRDLIIKIF